MIKKIYDYLSTRGMVLMVAGFLMAIVGLLFYMQLRYRGSVLPQIAFGFTIAGFVVYVVGRYFVATSRQRQRRAEAMLTPEEDDAA